VDIVPWGMGVRNRLLRRESPDEAESAQRWKRLPAPDAMKRSRKNGKREGSAT